MPFYQRSKELQTIFIPSSVLWFIVNCFPVKQFEGLAHWHFRYLQFYPGHDLNQSGAGIEVSRAQLGERESEEIFFSQLFWRVFTSSEHQLLANWTLGCPSSSLELFNWDIDINNIFLVESAFWCFHTVFFIHIHLFTIINRHTTQWSVCLAKILKKPPIFFKERLIFNANLSY